ncbi:dnaJ homolog subfamily C member 9-like [Amphiura filiformis]|uniref:dnaJ homolog subfamily C member 9-like n=1 Tax=Amphiura filiformis TaxID=82378 RepID=UPI003B21D1A2
MPELLESCDELFGTRNLYEILSLDKKANANEVKKGYYKLSLKVHPDRVSDDDRDIATAKFQTLGKIYAVLSDKSKRNLYDETGEVDDEIDMEQDKDWYDYWRILFKKVEVKDIQEFEEKYKGSDEEVADLKKAYLEHEGDMEKILEDVMCSTKEDEPRFRKILNKLIKKKEIPEFETLTKEDTKKQKERKRKAKKEAAEAEELAEELGLNKNQDMALEALIKGRHKSREQESNDFFAGLEAKYCQPSGGSKKSKGKGKKR